MSSSTDPVNRSNRPILLQKPNFWIITLSRDLISAKYLWRHLFCSEMTQILCQDVVCQKKRQKHNRTRVFLAQKLVLDGRLACKYRIRAGHCVTPADWNLSIFLSFLITSQVKPQLKISFSLVPPKKPSMQAISYYTHLIRLIKNCLQSSFRWLVLRCLSDRPVCPVFSTFSDLGYVQVLVLVTKHWHIKRRQLRQISREKKLFNSCQPGWVTLQRTPWEEHSLG